MKGHESETISEAFGILPGGLQPLVAAFGIVPIFINHLTETFFRSQVSLYAEIKDMSE